MSKRIRNLLAEDGRLMIYRPSLRAIAGSVNGAIILSQLIYWDDKMDGKFYKFTSPCTHEKYKPKESFEEELGMSKYEINSALSKFALKLGSRAKAEHGENYKDAQAKALVTYYTDSNRVTWYQLNRELLDLLVSEDTQPTLVSEDTQLTKESEGSKLTITRTETTTKTTTDTTPIVPKGTEGSVDFDQFWSSYPKKKSKQTARKAWNSKANESKPPIDEMLRILEANKQSDQWTKSKGEYVPYPASWINAHGWEDEVKPKHKFTPIEFAPIGEIEAY